MWAIQQDRSAHGVVVQKKAKDLVASMGVFSHKNRPLF